jgi:hypothetical protein
MVQPSGQSVREVSCTILNSTSYSCPIGALAKNGGLANVTVTMRVMKYFTPLQIDFVVSNNDTYDSPCQGTSHYPNYSYDPAGVRVDHGSVTVNCNLINWGGGVCQCSPGDGALDTGSGCRPCNIGQEYSNNYTCNECPAGTEAAPNRSACVSCNQTTVRYAGESQCHACPPGYIPNSDQVRSFCEWMCYNNNNDNNNNNNNNNNNVRLFVDTCHSLGI